MKIAVLLTGHLRTYYHTWKSWDELRNNHDVDFYILVWDHIDTKHRTWWHDERSVRDVVQEDDDAVVEFYDPTTYIVKTYRPPVQRVEYDQYAKSRVQATQIEQQWELVKDCYNLLEDNIDYDLIIRARPDIVVNYVETNIEEPNIVNTCDKACDAFFVCTPDTMDKICEMKFPDVLMNMPQDLVPEYMFRRHCTGRDLELVPCLSAAILREDGRKLWLD